MVESRIEILKYGTCGRRQQTFHARRPLPYPVPFSDSLTSRHVSIRDIRFPGGGGGGGGGGGWSLALLGRRVGFGSLAEDVVSYFRCCLRVEV